MKFVEFLKEYRPNAEHAGEAIVQQIRDMLAIEKPDVLHMHIVAVKKDGTKCSLAVNRIKSSKHETIILVGIEDRNVIAGYLNLKHITDNIFIALDSFMYPDFQNIGVGTDLYVKLAMSGYIILNGYSQSKSATALWDKLKTQTRTNVLIYNIKNNTFHQISDIGANVIAPEKDNTSDENQTWFYALLNASNSPVFENTFGSPGNIHEMSYHIWIGKLPEQKRIPIGFCVERYSDLGDF